MALTHAGRTRGPAAPAGPKETTPAKAPAPSAAANSAALEQRLQRARLLGHRPEAIAQAGAPSAPGQPGLAAGGRGAAAASVLRSAAADRVQRAIGFELEMQVVLSSGPPLSPPEKEGELAYSIDDLLAGTVAPRPQVEETRHTVVLHDGRVFAWDAASTDQPDGETVIKPVNHDKEAGRWRLVEASPENLYFDPLLKKEEKIYQDDELEVVEDHAPLQLGMGLASIPELVVSPRDEMLEAGEFLKPMKAAKAAAETIVEGTGNLTKRIPAGKVFPGARADLYLGFDAESEFIPLENNQKPAASAQATYAVQIGAVPAWLGSMIGKTAPERALPQEVKIIDMALNAGRGIMAALVERGSIQAPDPGLLGFLTVLSLYLSGGLLEGLGNVKNYVPLLNRNGLDLYVSQAGFLGPDAVKLFRYYARRQGAAELIAHANNRGLDEPVLRVAEDSPKVGPWLIEVLSGEDDSMRDYSRFGRSKKIPHEEVGPELGPRIGRKPIRALAPVFEERQVPGGGILGRQDLLPIGRWEDVALDYRRRLRAANEPLPESGTGPSSSSSTESAQEILPSLDLLVRMRQAEIERPEEELGTPLPPQPDERVQVFRRGTKELVATGVYFKYFDKVGTHIVTVDSAKKNYSEKEYDVVAQRD